MLIKDHWYFGGYGFGGLVVSFHRYSKFKLNPLKNNEKAYELRLNGQVIDSAKYGGGMFEGVPKQLISNIKVDDIDWILKANIDEDGAVGYDPILEKYMTGRWFRLEINEKGTWIPEDGVGLNITPCTLDELKVVLVETGAGSWQP